MLSSETLNDIKHLKFIGTASMNDLQLSNDSLTTPIRVNKTKYLTRGSIQRRRALGLVHCNSIHVLSSEDLSIFKDKHYESVILQAPSSNMIYSHPEDDLPHLSHQIHCNEDTFDDLIPSDERIEHMVINQINGVNIFAFSGGYENTIRCQSPQCSRVDISALLDILD